jgi:hypothetical protein
VFCTNFEGSYVGANLGYTFTEVAAGIAPNITQFIGVLPKWWVWWVLLVESKRGTLGDRWSRGNCLGTGSSGSLKSRVVCPVVYLQVPISSLSDPFISAMTLPCLGMMTAYAVPFPQAEAARSCFQLRVSLQVDPLDQNWPLLGPMIGARFYSCVGVMTAYAVPFPPAGAARGWLQLRRSLQVDRLEAATACRYRHKLRTGALITI